MSTGAHNSQPDPTDDQSEDSGCLAVRPEETENNGTSTGKLWKQAKLLAQAEKIGRLGSWDLNIASGNLTLSENLCALLGYAQGTQLHESDYWDSVHPDDRDRARELVVLAVRASEPYEYIARIRTVDGNIRSHLMSGLPIGEKDGQADRVIGLYRDVTHEAHTEDELHRLSQQLMRARDDERRHMARELHESAGQTLAALKMTLARLQDELPVECVTGHAFLRSSRELAEAAVREVRTVSYLMHPPMLDEAGLYSALRWYARGFAERSQIRVDVDISEDIGRQSQEIETTVFRVVQEALTNVHRYSGSRTVSISVTRRPESICVVVQDAGCGIPLADSGGHGRIGPGVGIAGMRERVMELEGTFQVESVPGRGTTIRTILPLPAGAVSGDRSKQRKVRQIRTLGQNSGQ